MKQHVPIDPTRAFLRTTALEGGIVHVMPSDSLMPLKSKSVPLSASERARCERVAARLHSDLTSLIRLLPEHARGGSGMSRHLGVVRNTCQRLAHALTDHEPSVETLVKLPGTKGLGLLVEAMEKEQYDQSVIEIATATIEQFDALIREYAGSHSKLIARIDARAEDDTPFELSSINARQALYQAATGITGRAAQTTISLYAFRHAPDDPGILQRAIATGMIQTTVVPGGMPVVISNGNTIQWDDDFEQALKNLDESDAQGSTPDALLQEFCSQPLPTVTSRGRSDSLIRVIDPKNLDGPQTFDVVSAARSNHPVLDPNGRPIFNEVWSLSNCPSTRLIFDIYLHEDMERMYRPSVDAQMWNPNLSAPGGDKWVLRYPQLPTLELLGRGLANASSKGYSKHKQLTESFFDRIGWDPNEFFGLRCEIEYPIWRGGYCIKFTPIQEATS
jgi:hypothetical protein